MMLRAMTMTVILLTGTMALAAPTGAPQLEIDTTSFQFLRGARQLDGAPVDTFEFNLILVDLGWGEHGLPQTGDPLKDNIIGFDVHVDITFRGSQHVFAMKQLNWRAAFQWGDIVRAADPSDRYLFEDFGVAGFDGVSGSYSRVEYRWNPNGSLYQGMLDERVMTRALPGDPPTTYATGFEGAAPEVGGVVARFIFEWDGTPMDLSNAFSIRIAGLTSTGLDRDPYFLLNESPREEGLPAGTVNNGASVINNDLLVIPEPATMGLLAVGLAGMLARRRGRGRNL